MAPGLRWALPAALLVAEYVALTLLVDLPMSGPAMRLVGAARMVVPTLIGGGAAGWLIARRTVRAGAWDAVALADAGRDPKGRPIDAALTALGATRAAVTDVLLTHGHPSETMGLAAVRSARIHAGAGDVELIAGRERPGRGIDRVVGMVLPHGAAQVAAPIRSEETLEIGGERVLALPVPGHSLGSTAYLVRGVLFVGDAAAIHGGLLVPGPRFMSQDPAAAERTLVRLARRLAAERVDRICAAHSGCSEPGTAAGLLRGAAAQPLVP